MKKYIYFILPFFLSSCYCTYDITIHNDGTAHIEITDWKEYEGEKIEESIGGETFYSEFEEFKNSSIISNYNLTKENGFFKVEYDIKNTNSLGSYLYPVTEEDRDSVQTTFKFENDQFIITHIFEENGPNEATMYGELIPLKVIFRFERDIKSFNSDIDFVKQINKRELEIDTDLNTISYGKGTKKVVVSF